ncbi:MAG: SPS-sensor component ptr3 [Cirrosporium novae-zelandiae]|nr:MAG: SPS-sensor component ptr3 [Cirrosporium novae-zelandiae]
MDSFKVMELCNDSHGSYGSLAISNHQKQALIWASLCDSDSEKFTQITKKVLSEIDEGTFAATDLLLLRHILDIECIRQQGRDNGEETDLRDAILEPQIVVKCISSLSKRLINHHNEDAPRTREWQLRALISAFALLNYHHATHLSHTKLDGIHKALGSLSQDAYWQQRLPNNLLSRAACLYLVRLAVDYSKSFQSDQPIWVTAVAKVLNFTFAVGVAYQYDGRRMAIELDEGFRAIRHNQQERYRALRSLCEVARATRIIRYWSLSLGSENPNRAKNLYNLASNLARLSIRETLEILNSDKSLETQAPSNLFKTVGENLSAALSRSNNLDSSSYMYGLLDNSAQLAQLFPIQNLSPAFTERLWLLIRHSSVEQFKEKSMEIILAFSETREKNLSELRVKVIAEKRVHGWGQSDVNSILGKLEIIRNSLNSHDAAVAKFWDSLLKLVPKPDAINTLDLLSDPLSNQRLVEEHETRPPENVSVSSSITASALVVENIQKKPIYNIPVGEISDFSDGTSSRAKMSSTAISDYPHLFEIDKFVPFNITQPPLSSLRQYQLSRKMFGFRQKSYFMSGISTNCRRVFFLGEALAEVFDVPLDEKDPLPREPLWGLNASKDALFRSACLGTSVFAVISGDGCLLHNTDGSVASQERYCNPIRIEGWDPECVTLADLDTTARIAVGWKRGLAGTSKAEGKITIYDLPPGPIVGQLKLLLTIDLPAKDHPKNINISHDGSSIACNTLIRNIIYAWKITGEPLPHHVLLCYTERSFSAEVGVEGITSSVLFQSRAENHYLLCTTSHSSQRSTASHEGEFSFLAPALTPFPRLGDHLFHPLKQFVHKPALQAAAVLPGGSIIAVLDHSGHIYLLPLEPSEDGGLRSAESVTEVKDKLSAYLERLAGSLRWCADRKRLYGADHKGHLVVVAFNRDVG